MNSSNNNMQIFVIMPTGKQVSVDVTPNDTIKSVKAKVQAAEGTPDACQLVYGGKMLNGDDRTLADANIGNEATLNLAVPVEGGLWYEIFMVASAVVSVGAGILRFW